MIDIVQIVRDEIVANIDNTVIVKEIVTDDELTITIKLCDYKWIKVGQFMVDENFAQWGITSINTITGEIVVLIPGETTLVKRQVLTIIEPTFVFGSVKTADNEWTLRNNSNSIVGLPLIWLAGSVNENEDEFDSPIDYEASLRIFFLDVIDMTDSLDDQQRDQGVRPMLALEKGFNDSIESSYKVDRLKSGQRKTLSIFGNEDKGGFYEMIFDEELGGVEARPTLTIYKSVACKC